jgi:heterodisulfide reductase subunit A-like polyferredoxin
VCEHNAIRIENGIAVVDPDLCGGCGQCAKICPKKLIEMRPVTGVANVVCSSHDKGKPVMDVCKVGCIGCTLCEKQCEFGAITMVNNLPEIDYTKCTGCGKCAEKCPKKIISIS